MGSVRMSENAEPSALDPLWVAGRAGPGDAFTTRGASMPADLRRRYGSRLAIPVRKDRPTVIANFVSLLDGVVALDAAGASGGGEISGFFEPDRFVMGLLRSLADAVLVGSHTVRAAPDHHWTADWVNPRRSAAFAQWRKRLGLSPQPTTVVVTASGDLDPTHPGLADPSIPVVILTTTEGAAAARQRGFSSHVTIEAVGQDRVEPSAILHFLALRGAAVVLCEGGPSLLSQFVRAGLLDELFLTVAPQLVGRGDGLSRLALLEGGRLPIQVPSWGGLKSVHRAGSHLFLRYAFSADAPPPGGARA
jgi:riboflavin biosynthesis pyrimidine reductase